jgi:hypothetical protein
MINSFQPRKKFIGKLFAGVALGVALLTGASALAQTPEENAQVTLTGVNFRPLKSLTTPDYVDITTAMPPHTAVALYDKNGMPTFRVKRALSFEINIASFNSSESYRPLAVYFKQKTNAATTAVDSDGQINFTQSVLPSGKLLFRHNCVLRGDNGNYEFFVLIQRVSDGVVRLIDPDIETESTEA